MDFGAIINDGNTHLLHGLFYNLHIV